MEPGSRIERYGQEWIVLDNKFKAADGKEGTLILAADMWERLPFDEKGGNYYPESTICKYMEEATQELIGDEETGMVELSMTAEDGTGWEHEQYRTNGLFLLTTEMYRKYRRYIPKMSNWWWTATAYSFYGSKYSGHSCNVRNVHTDGTLSNSNAYNGYRGVVPALIIL